MSEVCKAALLQGDGGCLMTGARCSNCPQLVGGGPAAHSQTLVFCVRKLAAIGRTKVPPSSSGLVFSQEIIAGFIHGSALLGHFNCSTAVIIHVQGQAQRGGERGLRVLRRVFRGSQGDAKS